MDENSVAFLLMMAILELCLDMPLKREPAKSITALMGMLDASFVVINENKSTRRVASTKNVTAS